MGVIDCLLVELIMPYSSVYLYLFMCMKREQSRRREQSRSMYFYTPYIYVPAFFKLLVPRKRLTVGTALVWDKAATKKSRHYTK